MQSVASQPRDAQTVLCDDYPYVINKFRCPAFEEATGEDMERIEARLQVMADEMVDVPRAMAKARMFACIVDHIRIDVSAHDYFPAFSCWDRNNRPMRPILNRWKDELFDTLPGLREELAQLLDTGCLDIWPDFDHSVPDWDALYTLGFPGIRARAADYRALREADHPLSEEEAAYFDSIAITYAAALRLLERLRDLAASRQGNGARVRMQVDCLTQLMQGPPRNTYEVLQLIFLYFILSEHIGHLQVRSLGNLDQMLLPYYRRDLAEGAFTEAELRRMISYFLMQFASINNYWGHPLYLGGTLPGGESAINELSYLILDCFYALNICTPKIQIKLAENTPEDFLRFALERIRDGNSSFVFVGEKGIGRAMRGIGFSPEEIRACDINGCYEYNVRGREVKTAPLYLNVTKPIELALHDGVDPRTGIRVGPRTGSLAEMKTYDDFYRAYIAQLHGILERGIACCNRFEAHLDRINPTPLFSATIEHSLATAEDAFARGSVYNNSGALQAGLATAADALTVLRKYVYEKNELTLEAFSDILDQNWTGSELLRRRILRDHEKFGNGLSGPDATAAAIAQYIGHTLTLRPNARGGFWKAGLHSARIFIVFGGKMNATPDGRMAGEEISKNASPAIGQDVSGVTALEKSVTGIDTAMYTEDFCLDVMMLPATVAGEEGLDAMARLVRTYMEHNGIAIHFNIYDEQTLLDAQANPERYQNLQVRVCGWNVLFHTMDKKEQDKYIERARAIAQ